MCSCRPAIHDGHPLATGIPTIEQLVGSRIERLHAEAGYRGHNAPPDYKFKILTSRQKSRLTPQIKREMRRRSAIEPVIGHLDGPELSRPRRGRSQQCHPRAAGYNFLVLATLPVPSKSVHA
jgi:IS5 family transposase